MSEVSNQTASLSPEGRKAFLGAYVGFTVDMFDVYLPIVALGPAMEYFQPKSLSSSLATTLYYVVFILSMLGRPLGSFIFGHLADRIGRKKTNQISLLGLAISTLLITILPGYSSWGLGAIITLSILRFISGIFMGENIRLLIRWPWSTARITKEGCSGEGLMRVHRPGSF